MTPEELVKHKAETVLSMLPEEDKEVVVAHLTRIPTRTQGSIDKCQAVGTLIAVLGGAVFLGTCAGESTIPFEHQQSYYQCVGWCARENLIGTQSFDHADAVCTCKTPAETATPWRPNVEAK